MKHGLTLALGAVLLAGALSGCESASVAGSVQSPPIEQHAGEDVQNRDERQLVMLFQGLLRMDRQQQLAITGQQAKELLPYVQKSKDNGGMNEAERQQVLEVLSEAQKSYLDDEAKQTAERIRQHNGGEQRDRLSPEQRQQMIEQFEQRRRELQEGGDAAKARGNGRARPASGGGMGKSVEQQLIELLQSKQ